MYFLGFDPGLSEVGFGIVSVTDGEPKFVDCGIIKTTSAEVFSERLLVIKRDLKELLSLYPYAGVGIEELFFVKNITNGIKVAHARGVIVAETAEKGYPIREFKPTEIKKNICDSGQADKQQVQEMVRRLLCLNTLPKPHDAADALAIAILTARMHNR